MNSGRSSDNVRKIFSIFISFVLCFSVVLLTLLVVFYNTMLNEGSAKQSVKSSGYVAKIGDELQQEFTSLGSASGFSSDFFKTVISSSALEKDIIKSIENLYQGKDKYKSETFEANLYEKLVEDGKSRGYTIGPEIESNLKYLASVCADTYNGALSALFYQQISSLIQTGSNLVGWSILGVSVLIVIMLLIMLIINIRYIHRFIRYCIYLLTGCCLSLVVPLLWVYISEVIDRIAILDVALKAFVVTFLYGMLGALLAGLLIIIAILVVLIILYNKLFHVLKSKVINQKEKEKEVDNSIRYRPQR